MKKRRGRPPKAERAAAAQYTPEFQTWWKTYPDQRAQDKAGTFEAWLAAGRGLMARGTFTEEADAVEYLQERVEAFRPYGLTKGKFCPMSKTWLNQGGYNDDPKTWAVGTNNDPRGTQAAIQEYVRQKAQEVGDEPAF